MMIMVATVVAALGTAVVVALLVGGPTQARTRLAGDSTGPVRPSVPALSWRVRVLAGGGAGVVTAIVFWPSAIALILPLPVGICVLLALGRLQPAAVRREQELMTVELPGTLELLAGCLGSGMPLPSALKEVTGLTSGPLAARLTRVIVALELGADDAGAWNSLREDPVLGRLARDAVRSSESGAPLADVLLGHAVRARVARHQMMRGHARTAGVRSVLPVTLCFLPAFLLIGVVPIVAGAITALLP